MGFAVSLTAVALILAMPLGRVTGLMAMNAPNSEPVQVRDEDGALSAVKSGSAAGTGQGNDQKFRDEDSAYINLVSVFLITAVANVATSGVVIVWSLTVGGDDLLSSHAVENHILAGLAAFSVLYSGLQMVTSIKALYQVAVLIQKAMRVDLEKSGR